MPICKICGSDDWDVIPQVGALEIIKCRKCGVEELVHTYYVHEEELQNKEIKWFLISIKLPASVTAKQIKAIKEISKKFEKISPVEIKKLLIADGFIELGQYPPYKVDDILESLKKFGIEARVGVQTASEFL